MPADHASLAELRPGERIRIEQILFEALREHCLRRGLHEGDAVSRVPELHEGDAVSRVPEKRNAGGGARDSGGEVLLRTADGRLVPCERDWARFVQVHRCTVT